MLDTREKAVQVSVKISKLITDSRSVIVESRTGQVAIGGEGAVIDKYKKLVDRYFLVKKDEDLGKCVIW